MARFVTFHDFDIEPSDWAFLVTDSIAHKQLMSSHETAAIGKMNKKYSSSVAVSLALVTVANTKGSCFGPVEKGSRRGPS